MKGAAFIKRLCRCWQGVEDAAAEAAGSAAVVRGRLRVNVDPVCRPSRPRTAPWQIPDRIP